jgi:hypothetical protein
VKIGVDGDSSVQGLYVAGEASGGLHGRNRLMGNSLLDIIVFGRRAGQAAAKYAKTAALGVVSVEHLTQFRRALKDAGISPALISPRLIPDYVDGAKSLIARLFRAPDAAPQVPDRTYYAYVRTGAQRQRRRWPVRTLPSWATIPRGAR